VQKDHEKVGFYALMVKKKREVMSHADMLFVRTDGGFGGVCHRQALHMVGVS
jgi:hypothetical protein